MTSPCWAWLTRTSAVLACVLGFGIPAASGEELVVTQVASLSGSNGADSGQGLRAGAQAVFKEVNERGGIHGRRIRFLSLDDIYDPAKTVSLTRETIARDNPIALLNYRGTANTLALIDSRVLEDSGIPLVGTLTGAPAVQKSPFIFHTRTSYPDEVRKLVQALAAIGHKRLAVIHSNDAFGKSGWEAAEAAAKNGAVELRRVVFEQKGEGSKQSIDSAIAAAADGSATAALLVAVGEPAFQLIEGLRGKAPGLSLYALSVIAPAAVVARVGAERARGIGFSQVYPLPYSGSSKLVAEYTRLMTQHAPDEPLGYFSLEGFVNAKVLVEALRRTGPQPTRARLLATLRSMDSLDIGGMSFNLTKVGTSGSSYSELVVLGAGGRLLK